MRNLKVLVASLALAVASSAIAADHPALSELTPLLTQRIDSDGVQALVKKYDLQKSHKFGQGSFTPEDMAYRLIFRHDRIESIKLQASPWPKGDADANWTAYTHPLPRDLKATDSREDVERKLGKPTKPGGDRWVHEKSELWVHFAKKEASIEAIWISPPPPTTTKP